MWKSATASVDLELKMYPRLQVRQDSSAGMQMATASRCTCVACCQLKGYVDLFKATKWADQGALPANKVNR